MKKIYIFLILLTIHPLMASVLRCSECDRRISGKYLRNDQGENFCSGKCFKKSLPTCDKCRRACEDGTVTLMGKTFCSSRCAGDYFHCSSCGKGMTQIATYQTLTGEKLFICPDCRRGEPCYYCSIPGASVTLMDKRKICRKCNSSAVTDPREVGKIFNTLRRNLAKWYGFDQKHDIELHVVGLPELEKNSASLYRPEGSRQMALMKYRAKVRQKFNRKGEVKKEKVIDDECHIFVLHTVPRKSLIDALAHELAHDHLRHNVGKVKVLADEEGFSELVASLYNTKIGNSQLNKLKEANPDKVYGGGFRKMRRLYLKNGRSLKKLMEYLK